MATPRAMPSSRLLITGATGNVGREVVRAAVRAGLAATAALRRLETAQEVPPGVPKVRLDFHDATTWAAALDGHDAMCLVRPPAIADVQRNLLPFINTAYACGVTHIVFCPSLAPIETSSFLTQKSKPISPQRVRLHKFSTRLLCAEPAGGVPCGHSRREPNCSSCGSGKGSLD